MDVVTLNNGNKMPGIILGTFQMKSQADMDNVVKAAVDNKAMGFDTSPSYKTEEMLANSVKKVMAENPLVKREDFFITSKIDSWQMIERRGDIRPFVESILKKTGLEYWDLLLIHWPQPEFFEKTWLSMEKLYEEKIIKNIGVCNCKERHFKRLEAAGANYVPMVAQNEIHPLNTENDVVGYCNEHNITVQAYSPLGRMIADVRNNAVLNILADKYKVSVPQLMIRWHIQRGLVPIVKTSSAKRVKDNINVYSFEITREDMELITSLDRHLKLFLESRCCPGF